MTKTHALAFGAGVLATLAALAYAGPAFIIQAGLRYEAARTHYVFDAYPAEIAVREIVQAPRPGKGKR